ncbi:DedA-like protein [Chloropicon primus]|uniref:DedA-like protein n=1 Tax=Chloropicon primus TaxID=1764295 RepID=A0A5B8MV49_9CHLO|nr:DedA-like protein [Chloropicon primus]UPR02492.1 DedA-like protein [Chloropicon primus]|eukprot:QDZ23280.1 DedA-like protein [Chloropicon primus]
MLALAVIGATLLWGSALSPSALAAGRDSTSVTLVQQCISFMLHLDKHLMAIISKFGEQKTYGLLAAIVFCETGLVVTPFLPGDSLLFACGTFAALGSLKLQTVILVLLVAAVAGDAVNYCVGQWVGRRILASGLISSKNIEKTERFYGKHGPKTIVLARFVPIVRTFAPFVAGVGSMEWREFSIYNVVGAIAWTTSFTLLGFFFGNLPFVQHNFTLVVLGIVAISVLPVVYEVMTTTK